MEQAPRDGFAILLGSWDVAMQARRLSPNTRRIYLGAAGKLAAWVREHTEVLSWEDVGRRDIEAYLAAYLATSTPANVNNNFRAIQQLFRWLTDEDEIGSNPMIGLRAPRLPEKVVPVLTGAQLRALLDSCAGRDLVNRRDLAVLRLFAASGLRLGELAGLDRAEVNVTARLATVTGKGDRQRVVRFDPDTAVSLDRYLRVRDRDRWAERRELWLAEKGRGPMTRNGIYQMVVRRGDAVGIDLHPHMLRHTFAHRYLAAGGAEGDLMEQAGWRSPQMLRRYGASAKAERARTAYDRVGVMDDL